MKCALDWRSAHNPQGHVASELIEAARSHPHGGQRQAAEFEAMEVESHTLHRDRKTKYLAHNPCPPAMVTTRLERTMAMMEHKPDRARRARPEYTREIGRVCEDIVSTAARVLQTAGAHLTGTGTA